MAESWSISTRLIIKLQFHSSDAIVAVEVYEFKWFSFLYYSQAVSELRKPPVVSRPVDPGHITQVDNFLRRAGKVFFPCLLW